MADVRVFSAEAIQQLAPQAQQAPEWVNHPEWFQQKAARGAPLRALLRSLIWRLYQLFRERLHA
jgi:hypothetical protein